MNEKKIRFCIVTYENFPNPITQNLKTYLLENYNCDLLYIFHQMAEIKSKAKMSSQYNLFKNKKLVESKASYNWKTYWPFLYLKDVLYTLFWCLKFGRIDVYFAAGNLNPVAGIILKRIGIVKKVIYQSMDYYPTRFQNKFLNWFYFQLDTFCVKYSDETWNVSSQMVSAREKKMGIQGNNDNKLNLLLHTKQYTVPGCIWFYKTKRLPFAKVNRKKIVYRGSLLAHMGIDLIIKAMPFILKKDPSIKLEIVGSGEEEEYLKNLVKDLKVSKNVIFHGLITDRKKLERMLSDAAVGIATFNTDILDEKVKNADPGKIKDYMLLGMPIITTDAISYSKQIIDNRCGIVIRYDEKELAAAVLKLINNKNMLKEYRDNALKFIEKFDCSNILKPNLKRILS